MYQYFDLTLKCEHVRRETAVLECLQEITGQDGEKSMVIAPYNPDYVGRRVRCLTCSEDQTVVSQKKAE